jgi:hypothetical protein
VPWQWRRVGPAIRADAERFDEALPARGHGERGAKFENLPLIEVAAELGVERLVDLGPDASE